MNPRMLVEFVDGSKTMVEMAAIANATGLVPDVPGMHGPTRDVDELAKVLMPAARTAACSPKAASSTTRSARAWRPASSSSSRCTHPRILERMDDLQVGKGPYFTFFRPYHLTSLEVPLTAAAPCSTARRDMLPLPKPVAEVCARRQARPQAWRDA